MKHPLEDQRIDWAFLKAHGFDEPRFRREADLIRRSVLTEAAALIAKERIAPAPERSVTRVAASGTPEASTLIEAGRAALARGEVATILLNGGMATRFGGVVKGVVDVYGGQSFIALKAEDVRRARFLRCAHLLRPDEQLRDLRGDRAAHP
jgi:UTP--glucose-1-phosphate uridylyltransferase